MSVAVGECTETEERGNFGMPTLAAIVLHQTRTVNGLEYQFTPKHHGAGGKGVACWLPALSLADEFAVFGNADALNIADGSGNLFGAARMGERSLRQLGTFDQQIAKFPFTSGTQAWHGYPVWALDNNAAPNLRSERQRPRRKYSTGWSIPALLTRKCSIG
jgi:hypothetical protein